MKEFTRKRLVADCFFVLLCLITYNFFPANNLFQQIMATVIFLVLMPLSYKKFVLKEPIIEFGFKVGDWKKGLIWMLGSLFISLLIYLVIFKSTNYLTLYKLPVVVVDNFWTFLLYETLLVPFFVAIYELFFRGFLLFNFAKKIGIYAILLQFSIFILLMAIQGFKPEFLPYLIFSFFAGLIAYKSDSMLYSFLGQTILIFLVDVSVIKMFH